MAPLPIPRVPISPTAPIQQTHHTAIELNLLGQGPGADRSCTSSEDAISPAGLSFMPGPEVAPFHLSGDRSLLAKATQSQDALGLSFFAELDDLVPRFTPSSFDLANQSEEQDAALIQTTLAALFGSYPGGGAAVSSQVEECSQNTQDVFDQFLHPELEELFEREVPAPGSLPPPPAVRHVAQRQRTVTHALAHEGGRLPSLPAVPAARALPSPLDESPTVVDNLNLLSPLAVDPMVLHAPQGMTTRSSARLSQPNPQLPQIELQPQQDISAISSPLSEAPPTPRLTRPFPRRRTPASRIIPYDAPVQPRRYQGDSLTARKQAQANVLERVEPRLREGVKRILQGKDIFSQSTEEDELDLELEEEPEPPKKKQKGKAAAVASIPALPSAPLAGPSASEKKRKPRSSPRASLEAEILAAAHTTIDKAGSKRFKNTMSQRRSREKKRSEMATVCAERDALQEEVEHLRRENEGLRQQMYELVVGGLTLPAP
ncbi:hypothetical protein DACRYDRAFT_106440 [Dacryopinax primogenitus]|uniref:BZIP domain-containing protein n=1 Tax=Dacryopinax primogenitus (strain DJM 731) TaxID=1858805 RepID=M5G4X3_DACPD|nr:uncharacterized protein DACRYDRAFT_106440 [Dacryopinax primogenitus]EJU03275.1 hypothetical protein DACRYDRAFT_106440 [Dacryopinax primogenitus]